MGEGGGCRCARAPIRLRGRGRLWGKVFRPDSVLTSPPGRHFECGGRAPSSLQSPSPERSLGPSCPRLPVEPGLCCWALWNFPSLSLHVKVGRLGTLVLGPVAVICLHFGGPPVTAVSEGKWQAQPALSSLYLSGTETARAARQARCPGATPAPQFSGRTPSGGLQAASFTCGGRHPARRRRLCSAQRPGCGIPGKAALCGGGLGRGGKSYMSSLLPQGRTVTRAPRPLRWLAQHMAGGETEGLSLAAGSLAPETEEAGGGVGHGRPGAGRAGGSPGP